MLALMCDIVKLYNCFLISLLCPGQQVLPKRQTNLSNAYHSAHRLSQRKDLQDQNTLRINTCHFSGIQIILYSYRFTSHYH